MTQTFADLIATPNSVVLDHLVEEICHTLPVLDRMGDPTVALQVIGSGVFSSYLFVQQILPRYIAHIYQTLTFLPPVDDELGGILAGIGGMIQGELYNNNIFGRRKECHSHYHDIAESYTAAGGNPALLTDVAREIRDYYRPDCPIKTKRAAYISYFSNILPHPMTTFILIPAIEKTMPPYYAKVSKNLCREPRFDKYRTFIEKHIDLDTDEHSPIAMRWLEYVLTSLPPDPAVLESAVDEVINAMRVIMGKKIQ